MNSTVGTPVQKPVEVKNLFRSRLTVLALLFGCCFFVVFCRLWQLQITRYQTYHALATRGEKTEKMVPALRGPIFDRNGEELAADRPYYDISVRVGDLKFERFSMDRVRTARERFKDDSALRNAEFERLAGELCSESFVRDLAQTLHREEMEVAEGLIKAIDSVTRTPPWASPKTPLRIVGGVDEKTWLALRAAHEDTFRGPAVQQHVPFPGLACTISTRRVYPHGKLACFVLGALGELGRDEDEALKKDGILLENASARRRYWEQIRDNMDDERADKLERLLRIHPRDIRELTDLYAALRKLRPQELETAATLGLAEPLRWMERPPRMALTEPEMLWTGVGLPLTAARNSLPNRTIGELGVERWYNDWLRGKSGMKIRGAIEESTDDALQFRRNSQPREGDALALTISLTWQRAVERVLLSQEHKGAIVVLDVKTGDVLAMASNPAFDPNLFSPPRDGRERQERLRALLDDPNKPLLNRAIAEQYPLGSVMKSLVAAVALERGLVSPHETFECPGYIMEGRQKFRCDDSRAHGTVNLFKALRCSCNVTFHQIGARIGVENLSPYARQIFGKRSGVELPGEAPGIFPDRDWRMRAYPTNPAARVWTRGQEYLLAIGQGQFSCTVMQAAQLMAAIANDGTVVAPRLWLDGPRPPSRSLGISSHNLAIVRQGLDEVVNVNTPGARGTAYSPFHEQGPDLAIRVAGKTSTAEHKKGAQSHAWFAGYAPADRPQVAFAIVLEEAGHGGAAAAPLIYRILRDVYGTRLNPVGNRESAVGAIQNSEFGINCSQR
ncbi:MAG TPA: penicillin-binding transpeptidase domain-containing protein [Planctomycetota bacterium]|nr:penicillin-binding transpeptidase domain-containing protein [Planctomycetota bacterium]